MRKFVLGYFGVWLITIYCVTSVASTVSDGKIIVRVDDGTTSRCINSSADRITMHMRRFIINKDAGVFEEDKAAGLVINTVISGEEGGVTPRRVSFPRMYTANIESYTKGYTSIPIEEKLFSRFPLTNSGNSYDTAEIEFTILAKRDRTPFGVALSALADISKSLPAPINPFSEGFKYFTEYANKVVAGSLSAANNISQQSNEGKVTLSFSSTDTCTGDQEHTGTLAIVSGVDDKPSDGFVDIKRDYCWRAVLKPVFNLYFAPKTSGSTCTSVTDAAYKRVNNPYIAFYINAEPRMLTLSQTARVKTVTLPGEEEAAPNIKPNEIDQSISDSYETQYPSGWQEQHTNTTKNVSNKVEAVFKEADFFTKKPKHSPSDNKNVVSFPTTDAEGVAIDIAESLKRCSAHGVALEQCL